MSGWLRGGGVGQGTVSGGCILRAGTFRRGDPAPAPSPPNPVPGMEQFLAESRGKGRPTGCPSQEKRVPGLGWEVSTGGRAAREKGAFLGLEAR